MTAWFHASGYLALAAGIAAGGYVTLLLWTGLT